MQNAHTPTDQLWQHASWYQALTLQERLVSMRTWTEEPSFRKREISAKGIERLQTWKAQKPFDEGTLFAERLAQGGLSEETFLMLLAEPTQALQPDTSLVPQWLKTLCEALKDQHAADDLILLAQQKNGPLVMCVRALRLLVKHGLDRLHAGIHSLSQQQEVLPFDPEVIEQALLKNLANLLLPNVTRTLVFEMHVARIHGQLQGNTPQERYEYFMQKVSQQKNLLALFKEYPVLARQIVITIEQWVSFSLELLTHLCIDWSDIRTTFTPESDPGLLKEVIDGAGDHHRGGRSVLVLQFTSGFQLLYKPKPLAADVHFQELLAWLNERGASPALRTLKLINRGRYGWSEFIPSTPCISIEEVTRFYERQGSYLALLYVLDATDFHAENVIASGENPMLVDLESLFHPRLRGDNLERPDAQALQAINHSVLRIGFLPHQMWSNAQTSGVDLSGLAGREGQMTPWPVVKWQGSGTDSMRLVREPSEMSASANRPKLNGSVVELGEYAEHIIIGFQNMYRLLMAQRPELLAGFLPRFAHDEIRVIVRHTRAYASLLYESYHPDLLRDALERERFFDNLWKGVVAAPYLSTFIPAERRALQEGNIPIFTTFPGSRAIFTEDGEPLLSTFLVEPSLETVRQHLQKINEDDLNKQIWLIRASLATLSMEAEQHEPGHRLLHLPAQVDEKRTGTIRERARAAAQALGKRLSELALRGKDGVSWIGINRRKGGGWSLVPADESLYNGVPGITLFLGYLGALLDDTAITELARLALATVRYQVEHQKKYPEVTSIGAFEGLGAATYLYTHLGVLWNDVALLQEAAALVEYLPDLIRKDVRLDITGGAAGCIMSLLCLYDAFPDPRIMHVACQCGDHLISTAHPMKEGIGWRIAGQNTPLSGFSHGAAGIALSLFKLAAQSGEERFRQTAQATIAYERSLYSPDRQNWLDLRGISFANNSASQQPAQEPEESCMVTWCHGAPGIALSRLEALSYCDDGAMREEIEVALKTTLTQGFGGNHSLCHGDLGNLDVVLKAAHTLDNPVYQEHVEHLTTTIIDSMETTGWLTGVTLRVETPGLMLGLAGIGYELLRLTEPERVPSVLLLAPPGTTHPNWRKTLIASL